MKKANLFLVSLSLVLLIAAAGCVQQPSGTGTTTQPGKGRAVFTMTDAAANMESVSSVKMTVDSVKVHSAAEGWTTVSSSAKTYDLIELKNKNEMALLADAKLDAGTYDQVQLHISKVVVADAKGSHEAAMPSKDYKINGNLIVEADSTSTATFDFIAHESLHVTSEGDYVMASVVEYESKIDAEVEFESNNRVEIEGGRTTTSTKVGMDISGNVGVGLKIASNANLDVDSLGKIKIIGQGSGSLGITG